MAPSKSEREGDNSETQSQTADTCEREHCDAARLNPFIPTPTGCSELTNITLS